MAGDAKDKTFLKKALRGVRALICPDVCMYERESLHLHDVMVVGL